MSTEGIDLIRRMAGGDRDALARFYDAFAPLAFGLIRRLVGDPDEAADVVQDVFWELWRSAPEYDPARGTPEAWVTVRARSRGIDRVRAARRREEMLVPEQHEAADPAVQDPGDAVSDRWAVRGALATLPSGQREVIELAYLGGFTQSEISARLGQPLGTVKTRMRLGMERLRELMGAAR
jgi:RNA polymerase sigma-70 factor (ECF subfamily)